MNVKEPDQVQVSIPVWCDQENIAKQGWQGGKTSFNSSMVRLGGISVKILLNPSFSVSIPVWCDQENLQV